MLELHAQTYDILRIDAFDWYTYIQAIISSVEQIRSEKLIVA
jgi:hypothetical protein